MQAIIIAGGRGTRMSSIATATPKILLLLGNRPLLDYSINYLTKNGCDNIIVCTGHLGNKIKAYLEAREHIFPIIISRETKQLGTAGPLGLIESLLEDDFFVLFGDIYTTINLKKMFQFHTQKKADATMALHRSDHPQDSTVVKIDKKNKLLRFIEKPGGNWRKYGNLTKTSLYILKKDVMTYIAKDKEVDFMEDVFPAMLKNGKRIFGYVTEEYAKDIGTPKRYKEVQAYLKSNISEI